MNTQILFYIFLATVLVVMIGALLLATRQERKDAEHAEKQKASETAGKDVPEEMSQALKLIATQKVFTQEMLKNSSSRRRQTPKTVRYFITQKPHSSAENIRRSSVTKYHPVA